jgi:DNA-binding NarL/FixJ family response regulator
MSTSTNGTIKIMVAENLRIVAHSIAALLRTQEYIEVQGVAFTGTELMQMLEKTKPDIVLMDINMPEMNGVDATRAIDERMPWVRVIALTNIDQSVFVKKMFKAGARGFVSKSSSTEDLFAAIHAVNNGKTYCCQTAFSGFLKEGDSDTGADGNNMVTPSLTPSELDIVKLIAEGYLTHEIAEKAFTSKKTVERHKSNILKKFNLRNTAQLVKMAVEQGWIYY